MSEDPSRQDIKSLTIDLYGDNERNIESNANKIKNPAQIAKSVTKSSNLRDYQKHATSSNKRLLPHNTQQPKMSKMQRDVQSYINKTKEKEVRCKPDHLNQEQLDYDEEDEDLMYISERPNRQVPVPHKFHPGHEKRISNEFIPSKIKNETHTDSKAYTEASFSANKPHASILEKEFEPSSNLSMSMNPNYGIESEIIVNRDSSAFDMKNYSDVEIEYTPQKQATPVKIDPKKSSEKKSKESVDKNKSQEGFEEATEVEDLFTPQKLETDHEDRPIWQSQKVVQSTDLIEQDDSHYEGDKLSMKVRYLR